MRLSKKGRDSACYVIGVDEVGRGCIAGPVAVGVFCIRTRSVGTLLADIGDIIIKDSKKMSEKQRRTLHSKLR